MTPGKFPFSEPQENDFWHSGRIFTLLTIYSAIIFTPLSGNDLESGLKNVPSGHLGQVDFLVR